MTKQIKWHMCPARTQINLGVLSSLRCVDSSFFQGQSADMPILVLNGCTCHLVEKISALSRFPILSTNIRLSIYLSIYLSVYLSIHPSIHPTIVISIHRPDPDIYFITENKCIKSKSKPFLSIYLSIYPTISISIHPPDIYSITENMCIISKSKPSLSIYLSIYLLTYLPTYLPTYLSIYLSIYYPYVCKFVWLSVSIDLSIYLSSIQPYNHLNIYSSTWYIFYYG